MMLSAGLLATSIPCSSVEAFSTPIPAFIVGRSGYDCIWNIVIVFDLLSKNQEASYFQVFFKSVS